MQDTRKMADKVQNNLGTVKQLLSGQRDANIKDNNYSDYYIILVL